MKFGFVKEIFGEVVAELNGAKRRLFLDDFVEFGETITTLDDSSVVIDFNGESFSLARNLSVKIDQSVIFSESFQDDIKIDSLHEALKIIENFRNLEELIFIEEVKGFDYYDIDFTGFDFDERE